MSFSTLDYVVFAGYAALIVFLGLWVSREEKGHDKDASDYFLASKSLPWWAIGASLIASNISAEQFIGMSGSGFRLGLAIATYEWMAAVTLLIVAYFFLPIYLKKGIFTMPQFLEVRFDARVRTILAVFWLLVYVFVNLTSVLYLGALAMEGIMGVSLWTGVLGLAAFATLYSVYGGLKAVAWTDVVQVIFLVGGGLLTTYLALDAFSGGEGAIAGFSKLLAEAGDRFNMILFEGELLYTDDAGDMQDAYDLLPGLSVLLGGMWIANLFYWGCNQYIIQRALAAKDLKEAQRGVAFAGYLKMILPLVVVVPGIVAYALEAPITRGDEAYPWLLNAYVGPGLKGLTFAALIAAIVSSLASMMNSTATIFTMDLYRNYVNEGASQQRLVFMGRVAAVVAIAVAAIMAPQLASLDQVFQYIQEYTGFVSPGVLAVFIMGLFWKKSTANAALVTALASIPLSLTMKVALPGLPFIDRMGVAFLASVLLIVLISLWEGKGKDSAKSIELDRSVLQNDPVFIGLAFGILGITAALYIIFW
ncbi:MAG: sodium/sugar symporter [Rhodothermales bacterium]|nr:sodium/sugar symporter [Rhodothermales bacterium]MBO6779442.1 sodium/sugar symporter [Rhodothermales bacterium]